MRLEHQPVMNLLQMCMLLMKVQSFSHSLGPGLSIQDVRYHGEYWGHSGLAVDVGIPALLKPS